MDTSDLRGIKRLLKGSTPQGFNSRGKWEIGNGEMVKGGIGKKEKWERGKVSH
jgi:hypothetical protein